MIYVNQLEYRHIPYNHNVDRGGVPEERRNVATSGCGLCSLCMIVDQLTVHRLSVEECVRLSEENGANRWVGTSMRVLGPIVAEKFGLSYSATDSAEELTAHLRSGGRAIANVAGDQEGRVGLFSHVGHYIVVLSVDGDEVCILDPGAKEGKYDEPGREGRVRWEPPFAYCSLADLMTDVSHRSPGFHLFRRKTG